MLTFYILGERINLYPAGDQIDSLGGREKAIQYPVARSKVICELFPFSRVLNLALYGLGHFRSMLRHTGEILEIRGRGYQDGLEGVLFQFRQDKRHNANYNE